MKTLALCYLAVVMTLSLITFCFYGWDKRQARKDGWRTPESRLHWLAILGGWPGSLLAQSYFRHKTQKLSFKLMTWLAALVHVVGFIAFLYLWFQQRSA